MTVPVLPLMVQPHGELWAPTVLFVTRVKAVISWALPAHQVPSTTRLFTRLVFTATLSTLCYPHFTAEESKA